MAKHKIIGLSCGRKMGNSEILLKKACMGAEELGVETEIIRAMELNLKPCIGCEKCAMSYAKKGKATCAVKDDDMAWLFEKILSEDCGLIISCPIYHLTVNGHFKMITDRMLPWLFNNPEKQYHKSSVGASICVGGGLEDWTTLGLPFVNLFLLHTRIVVDQLQVVAAGELGQVLVDDIALEKAWKLGQNVARALKLPIDAVGFMGEKPRIYCPVCYSNILQVADDLPHVRCPICNINGVIALTDKTMTVKWNDIDVENSRWSEYGLKGHSEYITMNLKKYFEKDLAVINNRKTKYRSFDRVIAPHNPPVHTKKRNKQSEKKGNDR